MDFLKRFNFLAYAMAMLSIIAFTFAENSMTFMVLGALGVLVSWWRVERPNRKPVPRLAINFGVMIAALALFFELVILRQTNLLVALGHFMLALLLCKLFEHKKSRDYGQILVLTLLIVMSASILTTSLVFGVMLFVYFALGLYTSLVFHLRCETERALKRRTGTDSAMIQPSGTDAVARDIRRVTWTSAVTLMAVSMVVFFVMPRGLTAGLLAKWRLHSHEGHATTGFTDHVSFGLIGRLQQSNARVMTVKITREGKNIGSQSYQPYFRGTTLDVYDSRDRQWIASGARPMMARHFQFFTGKTNLIRRRLYSPRGLIVQHYKIFTPAGQNTIFAIAPPAVLRSTDMAQAMEAPDLTLYADPARFGPLTYSVASPVHYQPAVFGTRTPSLFPIFVPSQTFGQTGLMQSAPIPKRVAAMARAVCGPLLAHRSALSGPALVARDMAIARRFATYLRTHYPYSLTLTAVNPRIDPTEDFLFNRKKRGGDCEYFASAMIMFCRAVGLPARMVTGYHGGDYEAKTGLYIVRQRFAHAWVEVWIPTKSWVRFDPTPADSVPPAPYRFPLAVWFQKISQYVHRKWLSRIIEFNNQSRISVLAAVRNGFHALAKRITTFIAEIVAAFRSLFSGRIGIGLWIVWGAVVVAFVASGLSYILTWYKQRTSEVARIVRGLDRGSQRRLVRDLGFFDELCKGLRRAGVVRKTHETPRETVGNAAEILGPAAAPATWLVQAFYEIRYGAIVPDAALRKNIEEQLRRFKVALRHWKHEIPLQN